MPVSLLLCEGTSSSPDIRVLGKLLAGRCEIRPSGGKYGMGDLVKGGREATGRTTVFGILDGDFPRVWAPPGDQPVPWPGSDGVILGWRWERKEIENHLIDSRVVAKALGEAAPAPAAYTAALEAARDRLPYYEAARAALSDCRRRFKPLSCSFGPGRGDGECLLPDDMGQDACRQGMMGCVEQYCAAQLVDPQEVLEVFRALAPEFLPGGARYLHYLAAFAGKDLLWAMDGDIRGFGFESPRVFRERILIGIQNTTDDIGDWLPEWKALQQAVDNT